MWADYTATSRPWTGDTRLIHVQLLQGDPAPVSNKCDVLLTGTVLRILQEYHVMKNAKHYTQLERRVISSNDRRNASRVVLFRRGKNVYKFI
jgi:hypothetical protein